MSKPNKLVQLFVIATTAYSLYRIVSDFLETETGKNVKATVGDYYGQAKDKLSDMTDKWLEDEDVLETVEETLDA